MQNLEDTIIRMEELQRRFERRRERMRTSCGRLFKRREAAKTDPTISKEKYIQIATAYERLEDLRHFLAGHGGHKGFIEYLKQQRGQ